MENISSVHQEVESITTGIETLDNNKRRSSSRSIKRRKFDDEIVEYSLGLPGSSNPKVSSSNSPQYLTPTSSANNSPPRTIPESTFTSIQNNSISSPLIPPSLITSLPERKKHLQYFGGSSVVMAGGSSGSGLTSRNKKKSGRQHNHLATKDLGRWKPVDDLALIIGVQQTNDLRLVHLGTKFSCRFTVQELQQRWYALLYDESVSRVAISAMRNLHPDMVVQVQERALWSNAEEELLSQIASNSSPTLEIFEELLKKHADTFYPQRNAKALMQHWTTLRQYHLLSDQNLAPLPTTITSLGTLITPQNGSGGNTGNLGIDGQESGPPLSFNDAEDALVDSELCSENMMDEDVRINVKLSQRKNIAEIRHLENEIGRWHVLVDSVTSYSPPEFDSRTLAVFRGRLVRYLMRSREITIGRSTKDNSVDIDLSLEGPAWKVSRRQATLRLRNTGEFYLSSEGKRPIFVDGKPILQGNKARLFNNSVVEIACLRFIFTVNTELIRVIRNEAVRLGLPP